MKMKYAALALILCLLVLGAVALQRSPTGAEVELTENDSLPTRRQLRRSFFDKREVLVVYGFKDEKLLEKSKLLLEELSQSSRENTWRSVSILSKEASKVNARDVRNNILYLVGTPEGNPVLKQFVKNIPFQWNQNGILINRQEYPGEATVLSLSFYPSPENDSLPFSLLTGKDDVHVFDFFQKKVRESGRSFFRQNMDYEIYNGASRVVMGDFDEGWNLDGSNIFDFSSGNNLIHSSKHYDFISHQNAIPAEDVISLADSIEQTTEDILNFIGKAGELPRFAYHIYKSAEEKGLMLGNTTQAHYDTLDNTVHTVINENYNENFIGRENSLLLKQLLGTAKSNALESGFPIYFTDHWQREGYRYWAARLTESGNTLLLEELLDNELLAMESPLIIDCMSASLVAFLLETWGKETFLKQFPAWVPTKNEIQKLEAGWQEFLAKNMKLFPRKATPGIKLPYLKGFNFAHEGYSIYNGYGSRKATEALEKQKQMGCNTIAIVPYSYIRDKNTPAAFRFSTNAGSENDEGVICSAYEAKKMGMITVLKPQIFAGDSWPGEIEMLNEKDWGKFFDYYYRWIRHYAFLAEIHGMDVLCIGVEFTRATLTHEAEWRKMIQGLRGLFHGKLTYAANWGEEFENIAFWDELDFIGLNSYYPLSKNDNPADKELRDNFETVKVRIEKVYDRFKKPIVFTEIGFRSIDMPWKNPHAEGDDSFNEEHQQRCYEIIFEGIDNQPWCKGILWWKFPSYLEYQGRENSAFTPNNKKAEATVRKWFMK